MQRLYHRIDRLKGTVYPSLLQILKPLGKPRIDRGFLGWREHLIRIDNLFRCDHDSTFDALHLDKITRAQAQGIKDFLGNHHLAALADLANRHDSILSFSYAHPVHTLRL